VDSVTASNPVSAFHSIDGTTTYMFSNVLDAPPASIDLQLDTTNLANLTYTDFPGATSGTVTINSETLSPVPLPAAFSLFGSALAGLGGFGWWKRRGKVSRAVRG
jgi:hypothetical protein